MEDNLNNESQLAKWLNGQLSNEEVDSLNQDGSLNELQKIVDEVDSWEIKPLDTTSSYSKLQQYTAVKDEGRIIPLYRKGWFIGVAASIALVLGIWISFNILPNEHIQLATSTGEQLEIIFPDSSKATLGPNSALEYEISSWDSNPQIRLTGRAYFQGPHSKNFTVSWPTGSVRVTGTKFDVFTRNEFTSIKCYEGEIVSQLKGDSNILHVGQGVRTIDGKIELINFELSSPSWLSGKYTFKGAPLSEVILALESEFGIDINKKNIEIARNYTGGFDTKSLDQSLMMVFKPLNIDYTRTGKIVILSE